MNNLPVLRFPPLFSDDFGVDYRLPDWSVASGEFSNLSDGLQCTSPGELVYAGSALHLLRNHGGDFNLADANYGFKVWLRGQDDLVFQIRTRRIDSTNYDFAEFNFPGNSITLATMHGAATVTGNYGHTLTTGSHYLMEFWQFDRRAIVLVNGSVIVDTALIAGFTPFGGWPITHGFSLSVEQIPTDGAIIAAMRAYELTDEIEPQDTEDLFARHRSALKDSIEDPPERTWDSFKKAHHDAKAHRNHGRSEQKWNNSGYPIRPPRTEDWFA